MIFMRFEISHKTYIIIEACIKVYYNIQNNKFITVLKPWKTSFYLRVFRVWGFEKRFHAFSTKKWWWFWTKTKWFPMSMTEPWRSVSNAVTSFYDPRNHCLWWEKNISKLRLPNSVAAFITKSTAFFVVAGYFFRQ